MALTNAQQQYVDQVPAWCRAEITDYLERGVEVLVFRQNECGDDVPPYAVAPKENQEFWVGCWDSLEVATEKATSLGLRVVPN
ncbi:hypothetical protein PAE975_6106 (plasmid) [Pseudomonas aeruginosa]|uniref:hypothetical protein n=1 Tax=Pseudomonas aeruginosa TaxID=287 RepID=UPI001A340B43|nr:hypothetical protein [Pseudomonas aeruginosa]MBH4314718.1 hypothetical protein [Pseudomonas aeruginosa]MBH8699212.1 hypothetical protein [Pseudomonas aeruginosa]WBM10891.1 hypothetical protein M1V28_31290 [Pseudomonas aeruginosa]HEK3608627.1 hypothetical protein [Pseudomonas aeruginosa]